MNSLFKISFLIFLTYLSVQCSSKNEDNTDVQVVDLAGAYKQQKQSSAGISFFSDSEIEYIQLRAPEEIIINEDFLRVYADKEFIILIGYKQMFLFDRKSGEFIREIGQFGKGPYEYRATLHNNTYDYSRKVLIARQWNRKIFIEYNVKGEVMANPSFTCPEIGFFMGQPNHFKDSIYVLYYSKMPENNHQRLKLIDTQCNIMKTYNRAIRSEDGSRAIIGFSVFYKHQDDLMFFEEYCDTLFQVTEENLIQRFVFGLGEFEPSYEKQFDSGYLTGDERKKDFHINNLFESKRYLFIRFSYDEYGFWQAVYDKKKKIVLMQGDEQGYDNDIDNFVPLKYATSVNNDNELIGFIEAYNVVAWFETHPEKAAKLPVHLKKLKYLKPTDNPVIMIADLK